MTRRVALLAAFLISVASASPAWAQNSHAKRPPLRKGSECEVVLYGDEAWYSPFKPDIYGYTAANAASVMRSGAATRKSIVLHDNIVTSFQPWNKAVLSGDKEAVEQVVKDGHSYRITKGDHVTALIDTGNSGIQCKVISGDSTGATVNIPWRNLRTVLAKDKTN